MRGLKSKNTIVTGGASGIGQAIAQRLGEEGAKVGIFDINAEGADANAEAIGGAGGWARGYRVSSNSLPDVPWTSVGTSTPA